MADANQVMSNFTSILTCANTNLAHNGANNDITSLSGLTTPLPITEGGTGATSASAAATNLGVPLLTANNAFSGNNTFSGTNTFSVSGQIFTGMNGLGGVSPLAWVASRVGFDSAASGKGAILQSSLAAELWDNAYADASSVERYVTTGSAAVLSVNGGTVFIQTAPSGTAGNAATFTTVAQIFNDGGLVIGAPTGSDKGLGSINASTIFLNGTALGTASTKASSSSDTTVASVHGSFTTGDFPDANDTAGTLADSGKSASSFLGATATLGGDLSGNAPNPTVAQVNGHTPGGSCGSHQWTSSIDTSARPTCSQPAVGDISGLVKADVDLGDANASASTIMSAAHGLGTTPLACWDYAVNVSGGTQNGYAAGAYVLMTQGGTSRNDGLSVTWNSTTVYAIVGANGPILMDASSFNGVLITGLGAGHWHIHGVCIVV